VVAQTALSQAPRSTTNSHAEWGDSGYGAAQAAETPRCIRAAASQAAARQDYETALGGRAHAATVSLARTTPDFLYCFTFARTHYVATAVVA